MSALRQALPAGTIFNPARDSHFMRIKPVAGRIRVLRGDLCLAETAHAIRLIEVGRDFYDPALYLPVEDIAAPLKQSEKSTHCPLKGDAAYFDLVLAGETVQEIAWSYPEPFDFAQDLRGRIAFYPDKVTIEETGL